MSLAVERFDARPWAGMGLPATGDYVIPRGLSILHIGTLENLGTCTEPNVWVRHQQPRRPAGDDPSRAE